MRHGLRIPIPGSPPRPHWHRQLVEGLQTSTVVSSRDFRVSQGIGGTSMRLRQRRPAGTAATPVALTQSITELAVTLTAGFLIMRGQIIPVAEQQVTLAVGANLLWLQFTISPAATPSPTLHADDTWPTLDLGIYGWFPLSAWTVTAGTPDVPTLDTLYHPGGNISYAVS